MTVSISRSSWLNNCDLLSVDGIEFWDILELPPYVGSESDYQYQVKQGDRLDVLAYRYLEDSYLWWVIAWGNNIDLVPNEMYPGMILTIPDMANVRKQLSSNRGTNGV